MLVISDLIHTFRGLRHDVLEIIPGFHKDSTIRPALYLLWIQPDVIIFCPQKIDISVAYAIWSGLGTTLIATVGILWFREPLSAVKIISIGLIVLGVLGLRLSDGIQQ